MRKWSAHLLLGFAACAASAGAVADHAVTDPDARALAAEHQLSDAERLQLLHGLFAMPLPGKKPTPLPAGVRMSAGFVPGVAHAGIPTIVESDASLGVVDPMQLRQGDVATALPSGLALAAGFDTEGAYRGGAVVGSEARAKGFNVLLGGGVDLVRDPRNGRNFEYLGEDPLLAGSLAGAAIAGTQSQHVVSTVKHFALNDQETQRNTLDARIDEGALRESDLLAFELAIERGRPGCVMCAYNKVNGVYACGSDFLLNQVLKQDWGYKGWVMSDWGAVDSADYFNAGLDQESGAQLDRQVWFDEPLKQQIASGSVSPRRVSDAVRRILRSLYAVGADQPSQSDVIDYPAHGEIARSLAANGMVLLKNDGVLPLTDHVAHNILVVGGHADAGVISGGGSSQVTPYGGTPTYVPISGAGIMALMGQALYMPSAPLTALKMNLPDARFTFDSGYDVTSAIARAERADLTVVFATQWQTEGMDNASLQLPEGQDALIEALARANPNIVVVLETGNPVSMPWLSQVKAVLEAWYPGEQGGAAIADVLTGVVNPSGHLPVSFPASVEQLPRPSIPGLGLGVGMEDALLRIPDKPSTTTVDYQEGARVGYRWYAERAVQPLFPFGYGLSYTRFEYTEPRFDAIKASSLIFSAHLTVSNAGDRDGAALAQLYLVSIDGKSDRRLVAFARVPVTHGESRLVDLQIDPRLLAHWDGDHHRWRIAPGRYAFAMGASALDLGSEIHIDLKARTLSP